MRLVIEERGGGEEEDDDDVNQFHEDADENDDAQPLRVGNLTA